MTPAMAVWKSEPERHAAVGERVGAVGDPGAHDGCGQDLAVAVLYREPVEGVGVVRDPDLIGAGEHPQVRASAAGGAALYAQAGVVPAELVHDRIDAADVIDPRAVRVWLAGPARLGKRPVHVPFEEIDAMLGH
jgi:hypothetical protein